MNLETLRQEVKRGNITDQNDWRFIDLSADYETKIAEGKTEYNKKLEELDELRDSL